MMRLFIFVGTTLFGVAGGYVATLFGMEAISMGSFLFSTLGSLVGVYVGWKVALRFQ